MSARRATRSGTCRGRCGRAPRWRRSTSWCSRSSGSECSARGPLELDSLATVLGPTFAPLLGGAAATAAIWFMVFNMFHGTLQPLAGAARTLSQLAEDGLLPRTLGVRLRAHRRAGRRDRADRPHGDPLRPDRRPALAARRGQPDLSDRDLPAERRRLAAAPQRAGPRASVSRAARDDHARSGRRRRVGLLDAARLPAVRAPDGACRARARLRRLRRSTPARVWADRRREGKPGFAAFAALEADRRDARRARARRRRLPARGRRRFHAGNDALVTTLEDIFVAVGLLTITVGLVLPGAHRACGRARSASAAERLASGALADLNRGIHALGAGDLENAHARIAIEPVVVRARDEIGGMADRFNLMQHEIARASISLDGARDGLQNANEGLARMSRQNELLLTAAGEGIYGLDRAGNVTFMNPAASEMVGYAPAEVVGRQLHELVHHSRADGTPLPLAECPTSAALAGLELPPLDTDVFWHKNGTPIPISCTSNPIVEHGEIVGAVLIVSDISQPAPARRRAPPDAENGRDRPAGRRRRARLQQSPHRDLRLQRVRADARRRLGSAAPGGPPGDQQGSRSGGGLTQQLLAFSRKQLLRPEVLDVNEIVESTVALLQRLIGEAISVVTVLDPELPRTKADSGQVEQLLLNLSLNARDAMPDGGTITIETASIVGADGEASVKLSVRDTGHGMSDATRLRIFEPFYTTKEQGKGTGLGLSTVYGIVQQVRGTIEVDTAPDAGTSFTITMPATTEALVARVLNPTLKASARGLESILLVEDEAIVRTLVRTVLTEQGYKVVEAADPNEALAICAGGSTFDLLFTDVVMPGMNGHELAKRLIAGQPSLKVLFSSGYSNDTGVLAGSRPRHIPPKAVCARRARCKCSETARHAQRRRAGFRVGCQRSLIERSSTQVVRMAP